MSPLHWIICIFCFPIFCSSYLQSRFYFPSSVGCCKMVNYCYRYEISEVGSVKQILQLFNQIQQTNFGVIHLFLMTS
ncbi:hypothetical protein Hanom_Chr16g01523231 [Helianthus anomalus]